MNIPLPDISTRQRLHLGLGDPSTGNNEKIVRTRGTERLPLECVPWEHPCSLINTAA